MSRSIERPQRFALSLATSLLFLSALVAQAARADGFVGASIGRTSWSDLQCAGTPSCDRDTTGGTVRGGYQFMPYFGVEARYFDLGEALATSVKAIDVVPRTAVFTGRSAFSAKGLGLDAVFKWPVTDRVSVSGMVGIARTEARFTTDFASSVDSTVGVVGVTSVERRNKPYYGLGVSFAIAPQLDVSLEAERYRIAFPLEATTSIDLLGVGMTYRFR